MTLEEWRINLKGTESSVPDAMGLSRELETRLSRDTCQVGDRTWVSGPGIALQAMQEKKALSWRGGGRLRGFLELRRPWGFSPEA